MRQGLGLLSREPEAPADGPGGGEVDDEGEDLHLGTAEGAEQRVDLVDAANNQGPTEPSASGDLVVLAAWLPRGVFVGCGLAALAAGGIGVEPVVMEAMPTCAGSGMKPSGSPTHATRSWAVS